jgi:hypothetical protein
MKKKKTDSGIAEVLSQTWNGKTQYSNVEITAIFLPKIISNIRYRNTRVRAEKSELAITGARKRSWNSQMNIPFSQK